MHFSGGKGGTYQKYINLMPLHEVYMESHLGGGAIMRYKKREKKRVKSTVDPCSKLIRVKGRLDNHIKG